MYIYIYMFMFMCVCVYRGLVSISPSLAPVGPIYGFLAPPPYGA